MSESWIPDEAPTDKKPRKKRTPKPMTPRRLRNIATYYLESRTTTRGHMRRLLMNRVRKSLRHHEGSESEMGDWVDALLDDLERLRLIDDRTWATSRLGTLKRRGLSERAIRAKLREKRVEPELIDELLEDKPVDALLGAVHFARKRRIGPFREKAREENRDRDLGKLARGGYPFSVAREILDMDADEAFERSFERPE